MISGFLFINNLIVKNKLNKAESKIALNILEKQVLTDSIKNKDNRIVKLQEAVVFEGEKGKKALSEYADSVFNLRKRDDRKYKSTVAYYENYIKTKLTDTIYVPYTDTITNVDTTGLPQRVKDYIDNSISVPKTFETDSSYFSIKGQVNKSNVTISKIEISDSIYGRFVEKRNGLFKPKIIEYQVFNKNPYVNIENSKSAIYKPKKKNTFLKIAGVAILSFFIGKSL